MIGFSGPPPSHGRLFIRQQNCRRKARRNFFFFSTLLLRRARKPRLVPSSFLLPPPRYYPSNNPFRRCHRLYGPLCFSCVRPGAAAGVRHMVFSTGTRPLLTVSQLRRQALTLRKGRTVRSNIPRPGYLDYKGSALHQRGQASAVSRTHDFGGWIVFAEFQETHQRGVICPTAYLSSQLAATVEGCSAALVQD